MRRAIVAVGVASACLAGCLPRVHAPPTLRGLEDEGSVYVYLQPFPDDAARLGLAIGGVSLARADGTEAPLDLQLPETAGADVRRQRLLAWGRVPPATYRGLVLHVLRATVAGDEGPVDLLVSKEPIRVDLELDAPRGRAVVVQLQLRPGQAKEEEFGFRGAFSAVALTPANTVVPLAGYASNSARADLSVFDRRSRQVTAVIPSGREPRGVAIDPRAARAYVALTGEDQIQLLDLATGDDLRRILLRAGDGPREVGLTPDGRLLVVVNQGSNSASFVDAQAFFEVDRVSLGQEPSSLLLDREGRRAYVLNRRSNELTVLDLAHHAVVGTVPTDPEPLRASLNRAEDRLYVVHRGSPNMTVFALPGLTVANRIHVGLGASVVKVDPRTDLIYVGHSDEPRIHVYDAFSMLPVDGIDVPGPVSYLAIDDLENTLLAVVPSLHAIALIDLVGRRVLSAIDVGRDPYQAAVVGERF